MRTVQLYCGFLLLITQGTDAWTTSTTPTPGSTSGCPNIISRAEWRAEPTRGTLSRMLNTPSNVYVHHSTGSSCDTTSSCKSRVLAIQRYHMNTKNWIDISYNFLIGADGNVYEGRGWMIIGSHTKNYNWDGYGFCFIGDFTGEIPNIAALDAFEQLVQCGISKGHLGPNYVIKGHRDVVKTDCPGDALYNNIKTWSNYS